MLLDGYHSVLVLGGIRSGKSEYAETLVADLPDVQYVATGSAPDPSADPQWAQRVAEHRRRRPETWTTEETGDDPGRLVALLAEAKPEQTLLVDDLGGWLTAVLAGAGWSGDGVQEPVETLASAVRDCAARLVLISPEVGLSVVPATDSGRVFADALGTANQALAGVADGVVLVVAGQPTWIKRSGRVPAPAWGPAGTPATATAAGPPAAPAGREPGISVGMSLPLPDDVAALTATERLRLLDVPGTGLGALTTPVTFVAGVQATETPQPFEAVRVLLVHGVHEGAVAAGESSMGWDARLRQAQRGEGALSLLAGRAGATLQIVDTDSAPEFTAAQPIDSTDAMTEEAVDEALRYGWRIATEAVEQGMDLLVLAAAGPGQQAVASALVASITGRESPALLGRVVLPGGGIDDNAWMLRCAAVRDALHRVHGPREPKRLLAALGGPDFAVATGLLLGAAAGRVPVIIDGPVGAAAALVARELATQFRLWILLLDESEDPAAHAAATALSLEPLVKLGLGLGEGANALAVLPLVQAALTLSTLDTAPPTDFSETPPAETADQDPADVDDAPLADGEETPPQEEPEAERQEEPGVKPGAEPNAEPEAGAEARADAAADTGRAGDPHVA